PPPPPPPAAPDTGAWKPPTTLSPPPAPRPQHEPVAPTTPPLPAHTRQGAIDKAIADTRVTAVTRSQAKLLPYQDLRQANSRALATDPESRIWVVAIAGTLTSLAEPATGHVVAYLASDQDTGHGYDLHTGSDWPAWFDDLADHSTL